MIKARVALEETYAKGLEKVANQVGTYLCDGWVVWEEARLRPRSRQIEGRTHGMTDARFRNNHLHFVAI